MFGKGLRLFKVMGFEVRIDASWLLLAVLIILSLLGGNVVGGLWWCLIGMFLRGISQGSYRQVVIREALAGEPVRRFMREGAVSVPSEIDREVDIHDVQILQFGKADAIYRQAAAAVKQLENQLRKYDNMEKHA